jgi:heme-degrading monooxygenase HmoA
MNAEEFLKWINSDEYKQAAAAARAKAEAAEDDYYDRLGELVESHPIVGPVHRAGVCGEID